MNKEEYIAALKKQQGFIKRLMTDRRKRSEDIDSIVKDYYSSLVGKWFKYKGDYCCITGFTSVSNYITSADITVNMVFNTLSISYQLDGDRRLIRGIETYTHSFIEKDYSFDCILDGNLISDEEAESYMDGLYKELKDNFKK